MWKTAMKSRSEQTKWDAKCSEQSPSQKGELTYTTAEACATCNPLSAHTHSSHSCTRRWVGWWRWMRTTAPPAVAVAMPKANCIFRGLHQHFFSFFQQGRAARGRMHEQTKRRRESERVPGRDRAELKEPQLLALVLGAQSWVASQ